MTTKYFAVYGDGEQIGVVKSDQNENDFVKFVDLLHDKGMVLKKITKKEHDEYDEGDPLTPQDLRDGNYEIVEGYKRTQQSQPERKASIIDEFIKWLNKNI